MTPRMLLAIAAAMLLAPELPAQIQRVRSNSAARTVDSIIPRSGPVGTEVLVKSGAMPAITPLRVGFGAFAGFEAFDMVLSSDKGELAMKATVPQWASWDRSYRFIVFDVYFQPIALSEPFYATTADGLLFRQGIVSREDPQCVTVKEKTGEVHSLTGDIASLKTGDNVSVEGVFAGMSTCASGAVIRVTRVR